MLLSGVCVQLGMAHSLEGIQMAEVFGYGGLMAFLPADVLLKSRLNTLTWTARPDGAQV